MDDKIDGARGGEREGKRAWKVEDQREVGLGKKRDAQWHGDKCD